MTKARTTGFIPVLGLSAALLLAAGAHADQINFEINVNTTSLSGQSGFLDFQLDTGGSGTWDPAIATLTNFTTDGTLTGALPDIGNLLGSGSLPGTVSLNTGANSQFNEHTEGFTYGTFFDVFLNLTIPTVSGTATAGNSFTLNAQDSGFNNLLVNQILSSPVNLVEIDLDAVTGAPIILNNSAGNFAVVTFTPEPASWLFMATGLVGLIARRRFRRVNGF